MPADNPSPIPVFVLTGFLGSGKTTLLQSLLADPAFADTAVVMNEFGDVAIDHDLVRIGGTEMMVTTTGCLCCSAGSDLRASLFDLYALARVRLSRSFTRVVVETTGLADPAPAINQLMPGGAPAVGLRDHTVARTFELAGVVTLVDAILGPMTIERHFECLKQVAFADRIVITKTDMVRDTASRRDLEDLRAELASLNPTATIIDRAGANLTQLFQPRLYAPKSLSADVEGWLALEQILAAERKEHHKAPPTEAARRHGNSVSNFSIVRDEPVAQRDFEDFLSLLQLAAGPNLLRLKGLVAVADDVDRPMLVHAVQHTVHPLQRLDAWPSEDRRTRMVAITCGLDPEKIRSVFDVIATPAKEQRAGRFTHATAALVSAIAVAVALLFAASALPVWQDAKPVSMNQDIEQSAMRR
jgi:G3E family GTPase